MQKLHALSRQPRNDDSGEEKWNTKNEPSIFIEAAESEILGDFDEKQGEQRSSKG
ncbi:hypothetical protein [Humidesulfovibrio idahonensis]